jgi:hypothetical protein
MKTLMLILALSFAAMAQSMVGIPDATIEGSASNPTMTNRSNKTIVATLLVIQHADGSHDNITRIHKAGVAPWEYVRHSSA